MGSFLKDKKRGEIGERIVCQILTKKWPGLDIVRAKGKNPYWDFCIAGIKYEVKYDEMALDTGNVCFEWCNNTKVTGIFASTSDQVYYVIPTSKSHTFDIFCLDRKHLVKWLLDNQELLRVVNGGDKKKFTLLLVKRDILVEHINKFGETFSWVEPQN